MKIWKLVSGILCMVLFVFVTFQSCAAGLANSLQEKEEAGGGGGLILSACMLAGGIVSVVTRNNDGKGGDIAIIVLFVLAAVIGFLTAGSYSDLYIWSTWCLICAVLAVISLRNKKKGVTK